MVASRLNIIKNKDDYDILINNVTINSFSIKTKKNFSIDSLNTRYFKYLKYLVFNESIKLSIIHFNTNIGNKKICSNNLIVYLNNSHVIASANYFEIVNIIKLIKPRINLVISKNLIKVKSYFNSIHTRYKAITDSIIKTGKIKAIGKISVKISSININININLNKTNMHVILHVVQNQIKIKANINKSKCSDIFNSIPDALLHRLIPGTKLNGFLSLMIKIHFSIKKHNEAVVKLKLDNYCTISSLPSSINIKLLRKPFKRKTFGYDRKWRTIKTGPGTISWVPIQYISKFVPIALEKMEDPGFKFNNGFSIAAIENAMEADIDEGKFARGASTITMQLAKNLWLNREKNISRKLQEAILTMYLEQSLSKEKILELYMNIIEFGPGIYGIKNAANHYFNTTPIQLTLSQSLLLASVLPKPSGLYFDKDGKITKGRLSFIRIIMLELLKSNKISKNEYSTGIREIPMIGYSFVNMKNMNNLHKGIPLAGWKTN
ncbi:MAG TPA: hypothetical protein ENI61_05210 [Ignavibacteria bacterium]|nr:hypothetical protein [Ignavibacteria bacterium]